MLSRLTRHLNGPRGSALLFLSLIAAPHALAYSPLTRPPAPLPTGLGLIAEAIPIEVYGLLWCLAALLGVIGAWTDRARRQREYLDRLAWGVFVGLTTVWGCAYLFGWVAHVLGWEDGGGRGYLNGGIYLGFACFVGAVAHGMPNAEAVRSGLYPRRVRT